MKKFILYVFCFCSLENSAQHFEWASTGTNLFAGFKAAAVDQSDNVIVAGVAPYPEIALGGGDSYIHGSAGDSMQVNAYDNPLFIISYSSLGRINWMRTVVGRGRGYPEVYGIATGKDNKIYVLGSTAEQGSFWELGRKIYGYRYFIYCLASDGTPEWVKEDTLGMINDPSSFCITPDGNFVIAGSMSKDIHAGAINLSAGKGGANYVIAFDKDLNPLWGQNVQYHKNTCCTFFEPSGKIDVSPKGDIYVSGAYYMGANFGNNTSFKAPVLDSVTQYNQPYEGYLACYSAQGQLKWAKPSGGKSVFSSIKATEKGVVVGGEIRNNGIFFKQKIDTTKGKKMVLAFFDNNGEMRWARTTNASTINSIAIDQDKNIYASVVNKQWPISDLILEKDTLKDSYNRLIISSYSADGKYRWVKTSEVPMSSNEYPIIAPDHCGNIYVAGEMWYVLKSQVSRFDAAFVKGEGYGAAPFVAKLKNTLPPQPATTPGVVAQNSCVISPGPWVIHNFPNPFITSTEFVYVTSYADSKVTLEIFDMVGNKVATVFSDKNLPEGEGRVSFSKAILADGTYIAVLRGRATIATTRIVVSR